MNVSDVFLLVVRWLHLLSAVAWVGGSLFYLLVLGPALRRAPQSSKALTTGAAVEFRALVNTSIVVLVATGVVLAFDRLTGGVAEAPYVVALGVKSALSIWMFLLARDERRRTRLLAPYREQPQNPSTRIQQLRSAVSGYNAVLILGIIVLFLSDLLKVLFEIALSRS